jgi:hypothetical protein
MKPIALLIAFGLCLSVGATAQPDASEDELLLKKFKLEDWPRAYREQDTELLGRMLASSFQIIDGSGTWFSKEQELAWLAKNKWANDGFVYEIKRLDIYGGDTAIVAGEGRVTFKTGQRPRVAIYQSSNVLVKENGEWRAVSSHVSGEKEESLPVSD